MTTPTVPEPVTTSAQAMAHAVRLLHAAEGETDRGLMERYEKLADSWIALAAIQTQREQLS